MKFFAIIYDGTCIILTGKEKISAGKRQNQGGETLYAQNIAGKQVFLAGHPSTLAGADWHYFPWVASWLQRAHRAWPGLQWVWPFGKPNFAQQKNILKYWTWWHSILLLHSYLIIQNQSCWIILSAYPHS